MGVLVVVQWGDRLSGSTMKSGGCPPRGGEVQWEARVGTRRTLGGLERVRDSCSLSVSEAKHLVRDGGLRPQTHGES
jgi:hypothetical protein